MRPTRVKELLSELGLEFSVKTKPVEESFPNGLTPAEVAEFLAKKKSDAYAEDIDQETLIITADTLVTTATSVPIEALTVAIPDTDTAETWGMLALLSPTNIPFNIEASEVNRTDLTYGLQGSMVKSKIEVNNQISTIGRKDDQALYDYFFGASYTDQRIYTIFEYSDDTHGFGQSEIIGWNRDGNIEEITRPQFTAKLQAPFGIAKPFKWETLENQTSLNDMRKLAGLSILSV